MEDGIFHQRLNEQLDRPQAEGFRRSVHLDGDPVHEAIADDSGVFLYVGDFLRHKGKRLAFDGIAEHGGQGFADLRDVIRIVVHGDAGDAVQRIIEKIWVDLVAVRQDLHVPAGNFHGVHFGLGTAELFIFLIQFVKHPVHHMDHISKLVVFL